MEVVPATWQQTRHATKQASGNFLIPVGNKKKFNKYYSFSASKKARRYVLLKFHGTSRFAFAKKK